MHPNRQVIVEIHGPPIYLPSKQATALALVINELIANVLEYVFSLNGRDRRLEIGLVQDGVQVDGDDRRQRSRPRPSST